MNLINDTKRIKELKTFLTNVLENNASTKNFQYLNEWDCVNRDIETLEKTLNVLNELTWTNNEFREPRNLLEKQLKEYKQVKFLITKVFY